VSARSEKILALQFKYFGDAVLMTPSLRMLRKHFPGGELHVLVPEKIAPLFQPLPWLDRVWPMPHWRGSTTLRETLPVIRALRRERFDRSVDFASNDRGAIASFLIGARQRLGWAEPGGFLGRQYCYSQRVVSENKVQHESARLGRLLSAWDIAPSSLALEICADPDLASEAQKLLAPGKIICHIASSQPKKEWPLPLWAALHRTATAAGVELIFSTGIGAREQTLLRDFKRLAPEAPVLEPVADLALYLAVLRHAGGFVSGDTGPLHFAAGLGVPTLALFGPSSPAQWAPIGAQHRFLTGSSCTCGNVGVCESTRHCITAITPGQVFAELKSLFPATLALNLRQ
jgi:lipopolysaccharide heptosyltransferase III